MLCGALALGLVLAAGPSHAAPPQTIHYQGYLTSSTGAPVNGPVTIGVRIYTAASGGNLLWSDNVNVNVSNGHYQVVLGANALVPLNLEFDNPYFLAVSVGAEDMVPRQALHLVPYAYRAVAADTVAATATIGGAQISGLITAATIAGSQVTGPITAATLSGATLTSLDTRYFARGDLPPQGNTITVVDGANSFVGEYISITVGADGLPVIAYQGLGLLTVLKCGNPACSSGNSINGVGSAAGLFTSITLGADGLPVISFLDASGNLKVAKCGDAACAAGNTVATLDATGGANGGSHTSITLGADGLPVIAYHDVANGRLKVAKCGNNACSGTPALYTVDAPAGAVVGRYASIIIGADALPVISYYDATNGDLKVAKCANGACSAVSSVTPVDSAGDVGQFTAMVLGTDGLPVISYYDNAAAKPKVFKCGDAACSSGSATQVVTGFSEGRFNSIALGADGFPVISYFDATRFYLMVVKCGNAACSTYTRNAVDTAANVGQYSSLTVGADGLPVVAYYDSTNVDLKVVKCSSTFCTPFLRRR